MSRKKRVLKKLGQIGISLFSAILVIGSATAPAGAAADAAKDIIGAEGGKEALNQALKAARTKPALFIATTIVCLACMPAAGVVASPSMFIACGILIVKIYISSHPKCFG